MLKTKPQAAGRHAERVQVRGPLQQARGVLTMARWFVIAIAALSASHHAAAFHVALVSERGGAGAGAGAGAALRPRPSASSRTVVPSARYHEVEEAYDEGPGVSVSSLPEVLELSVDRAGAGAGADEGAGQGADMAADSATPGLERSQGQGGMADVYRRRALLLTDQLQRMRSELGKVVASKQPSDQQLREVVTDTLREDNRALLLAQKELSEQR